MSRINLSFIAGVVYREKIYASTREVNGLFQLDLITHEISCIKIFSKEKTDRSIYRMAFLYKNEAWFIPGRGRNIAVVNLDTLDIDYYKVPFKEINEEALSQSKGVYSSVYSSGGMIAHKFLYLIPANIDALLIVDLETRQFYPYYGVAGPQNFLKTGVYIKENIYILPEKGNNLIKIKLRTKEQSYYPYLKSCRSCMGIVYYDNKLWTVSSQKKCITTLDLDTQEEQSFLLGEDIEQSLRYNEMFMDGNEIFLLPRTGNKILKINLDTEKTDQINLSPETVKNGSIGLRKVFSSKKIILDCLSNSSILIYDKDNRTLQEIGLSIEKSILLEKMAEEKVSLDIKRYKCGGYYMEGIFGFEDFEGMITSYNDQRKRGYANIGENIWSEIIKK